jgi:hypothetical protein
MKKLYRKKDAVVYPDPETPTHGPETCFRESHQLLFYTRFRPISGSDCLIAFMLSRLWGFIEIKSGLD